MARSETALFLCLRAAFSTFALIYLGAGGHFSPCCTTFGGPCWLEIQFGLSFKLNFSLASFPLVGGATGGDRQALRFVFF